MRNQATKNTRQKFKKLKSVKTTFKPENEVKMVIGATKQEVENFDRQTISSYWKWVFLAGAVVLAALNIVRYFSSTSF